uniref:transposase n=1 Tax=Caballeronia sp. LjRoot34 TaxID=3342325 RepID=UPI003F503787
MNLSLPLLRASTILGRGSQFEEWFATEDDCARYLERLRWPDGFACPSCRTKGEPYRGSPVQADPITYRQIAKKSPRKT